jgi:hypothetical protein
MSASRTPATKTNPHIFKECSAMHLGCFDQLHSNDNYNDKKEKNCPLSSMNTG